MHSSDSIDDRLCIFFFVITIVSHDAAGLHAFEEEVSVLPVIYELYHVILCDFVHDLIHLFTYQVHLVHLLLDNFPHLSSLLL